MTSSHSFDPLSPSMPPSLPARPALQSQPSQGDPRRTPQQDYRSPTSQGQGSYYSTTSSAQGSTSQQMQSTHSAGSAHSASGSALVFPSPGLSAGSRQESFDPLSPSASQHAYHFHQQQAGYPSPSVASSEREEHLASGAASSSSFSHEVERELAGYPVAGALSNGGTGAGERSAAGSRQHSMDDGVSSAGMGGMRRAPSSSSLASSAAYNSSYDPHSTSNPYSLPNQSNGTSSSSPSLPPLSHLHSSAGDDEGLGLGSIAESSSALPPSAPPAPARRGSSTTALGLGSGIGLGMGLEGQQTGHGQGPSSGWEEARSKVVDEGCDEAVLRGLCDLDCGMPLLLDRMKQSMASAAEASSFFRKRALIEEEYARSMIKLARSSNQAYGVGEGKAGTYVTSYLSLLRTHETLGENRLKFAAQLTEMSEELTGLGKEVEKHRKTSKELGGRLERGLQEQEGLVDKARARFDTAAEELERLLILKQGESVASTFVPHSSASLSSSSASITSGAPSKRSFGKAMSKFKGPKNAQQIAKQEEETRSRMGQCSDAYRSQVLGAQAVRQEFFGLQLPRILRTLKEASDEVDLGTHYHLSRYAYIFESTLVTDGLTISPVGENDGPGLKNLVESIDIREDFKNYMQQYAVQWQMSGQKGPRREGPAEEGFLPPSARPNLSPRGSQFGLPSSASSYPSNSHTPPSSRPTFGVDLGDQMLRDGVEVPRVLEKCCEAIELHGLDSMGIYRLSGTTSRVQRLKAALDRDIEGTDLLSEENLSDINDIAAVMKLWFREMPEPLLTWELYTGFIEAAKIENDRLRHIRLHERVNDLPDPNYATLKYLMGHLDKVQARESINQMGCSNLAIVFGPNLLGAPPSAAGANGSALADMSWQCKVIETILHHYAEIFLDDAEV